MRTKNIFSSQLLHIKLIIFQILQSINTENISKHTEFFFCFRNMIKNLI